MCEENETCPYIRLYTWKRFFVSWLVMGFAIYKKSLQSSNSFRHIVNVNVVLIIVGPAWFSSFFLPMDRGEALSFSAPSPPCPWFSIVLCSFFHVRFDHLCLTTILLRSAPPPRLFCKCFHFSMYDDDDDDVQSTITTAAAITHIITNDHHIRICCSFS